MAETIVDVGDEVPSSTIRVNLEVIDDPNRLQINEHGECVAHIQGNFCRITTALFRRFDVRHLLAKGGLGMVVCYAIYRMGYNAGRFYLGSIAFDITTEPDKERTVRRRLVNGTFLQELKEEVSDIIEEHSDILGDLKDFTIISCKEIVPNKEKGGSDEVKDFPPISQEILHNKEKEGYEEVKKVGMKNLPPVPQGVDIVQGVKDSVNIQRRFNKRVELKDLLSRSQGVNIVQGVEVDVGGEVPLSTIRVKLEAPDLSLWGFNKRGKVDIYLEVYKYAIIAALSRQFHVFKTGEEASIGFAIEQLGCIVGEPSSECCITFDITIDSDKESTVRDTTFLQELEKEVEDIIRELSCGLFHLDVTGISCEKIHTKAEKGNYISQVAEGKIEALVKETRQLRMLMISLDNKFDGKVETKQSSKDQEPDTKPTKSFVVQPTRAETAKVTTGPEPPSADF